MSTLFSFIQKSFRRKLIVFTIAAVLVAALGVFVYLMGNFTSLTNFSLEQNSKSLESTVEDFLSKYVEEKAASSWLQIKAAQDNLAILGKTAQKLVDHPELRGSGSYFSSQLESRFGSLTSPKSAAVDLFVPPALASSGAARNQLESSALLNLVIDSVFEANANNAFVYFVGNPPVTRAFPNIDLAEVLGDGRNQLFWKDFFAPNVASWTKWFTDKDLQKKTPNRITVEAPYADAAGQGMMVTMFYPLWDSVRESFAGAVGADITLAAMIDNVLSIQLAKTGFAFLMNGHGDIIAMPERGYRLYHVNLKETKQGSLSFYTGSLDSSTETAVKALAMQIRSKDAGLLGLETADPSSGQSLRQIVAYTSLPAISDVNYQEDRWKIVVSVPENEIFEALQVTHAAISGESTRMIWISILLLIVFLVIISLASFQFSARSTRDLSTLAQAAEQISLKNYDIHLNLHSRDELGSLGRSFESMSREIRDYTVNLETRVSERTMDLQVANTEITRLNEVLRGENLRLGAELDVARKLQTMVLPHASEVAAVHDLDISCFMQAADEVGGDYYDVLSVGDYVFLGIGDVTGHGLSAGVIMLMAQTALLTLSQAGEHDTGAMLEVLNRVLFKNIERIRENKNMTLSVLRYHKGEFFVAGQHETVLVCRKDGTVENIETIDLGLPVGLEEDIATFIGEAKIRLAPGDAMVLYTDGITEAENAGKKQYGVEGLIASLKRSHHLPSHQLSDAIRKDLFDHIGGSRIYDDISFVAIKMKGEE